MAFTIASTAVASLPNRKIPRTALPGKTISITCLPGRTCLNATKSGVSSVCEPLPPDRPLWFPGSSPPEWLDGSLPGDFGFDPLGLGSDPELLQWFAQAELMHSRWAMLAVAGILIPEWLESLGFIENFSWYDAGSRQYFADPTTLFVVQLALMGWVEGRRWADIINPGSVDIEPTLPNKKKPKADVGYPGDRGISHAELNWPSRLKVIQGIARGMDYLASEFSSYELPHGNLKSSNIFLASNFEPLLADYAFYPLINNTHAAQSIFAYKSPEAILHQHVSPKSDVYCFGIVILEILTGKFSSLYLNNQKGGTDIVQWVRSAVSENRESGLIDPEIAVARDSLGQIVRLLQIGAACTESEHDRRIDMREAIRRVEEIQV
ncbi:hypothetical protein RJ639_025778 [Escallonia herrerae]|uniref:Protein kinase domain-containing protein n=1 Tax=Escallonia herrerae TaxID=1293975 RepID=A0AA88SR25_9ASTE|nr:hypothetical protein RJ639_025778 [Escallonia herrerae]